VTGGEWLTEASKVELTAALVRPGRARSRLTVALSKAKIPFDVVLELEPCDHNTTLVTMVDVVPPSRFPIIPVSGTLYELAVEEGHPPQVVRQIPGPPSGKLGTACWELIFGRSSACPDCPVERLGPTGTATGIQPGEDGSFTVFCAERRTKQLVGVSAWRVDRETFKRLMEARVAELARKAGLTDREKELLDAFLDGESLESAATRLGVSSRTVKYHQVNLLRKLDVESRLAIVRLLR